MIDIQEFEKRYSTFEKLDNANYPYTFKRFWSYKLKIENKDSHILDRANRTKTAIQLGHILKLWKWHEPYEFDLCFKKMEKSLETISDSYDRIRNFNLTEFNLIPENDLRRIWNEFSKIKDENNKSNFIGEIVETITKPLMLLWGQTPGFDSVVRTKMILSNCPGFSNQRWEFRLWLRVMNELQKILNDNSELVDTFRKKSQEKYGIATIVPYGQFFDLYYWTENKLDALISKNAVTLLKNKPSISFEEEKKKEDYHYLVSLLNQLRSAEKITAIERRNIEQNWRNQPNNRDLLLQDLERKIDLPTQNKQDTKSKPSIPYSRKKTRL